MEATTTIVVGAGLVILYLYYKGYFKVVGFGGLEHDITVDKQFGMNLVKNQLIQCPDGFIRFDGATSNLSGLWDISSTDGHIIRGVDPRINMRWSCDVLTAMSGKGTVLCNVRVSDGTVVSWGEFVGGDFADKQRHLVDLLDLEKRRVTNVLGFGFSKVDGNQFDRLIEDWGKGVGQTVKDIGLMKRGGYEDREIMYQRPVGDDVEGGGMSER